MLIMLVISAIEITAGLLLSVNGMYQHFFLASDKINSETIRFGNTYLYSALPFAFVLGVLLVLRNVIQGLGKPLFPFLAGIAELIARIVICIFPAATRKRRTDKFERVVAFLFLPRLGRRRSLVRRRNTSCHSYGILHEKTFQPNAPINYLTENLYSTSAW